MTLLLSHHDYKQWLYLTPLTSLLLWLLLLSCALGDIVYRLFDSMTFVVWIVVWFVFIFRYFFFFGHCCCFWCSLTSILNTNFIRWHRIGAALFRSLHHNFIALFSLHFLRHFLIFLSFVTLSTLSHTQYHFINFKRYFCILFSCHNETQDFLLNYFQFIFSRKLITDDKWMII